MRSTTPGWNGPAVCAIEDGAEGDCAASEGLPLAMGGARPLCLSPPNWRPITPSAMIQHNGFTDAYTGSPRGWRGAFALLPPPASLLLRLQAPPASSRRRVPSSLSPRTVRPLLRLLAQLSKPLPRYLALSKPLRTCMASHCYWWASRVGFMGP